MYDFERAAGDGVEQLGHPPLILGAAEAFRFPGEVISSFLWDALVPASTPERTRTVLVIPGFMATDAMTSRLRSSLARDGHRVHAAGVGRMVGMTEEILEGLRARVRELAESQGEPITVIGWSFGGLLARWLGHECPEHVDYVITVGSPWRAEGEVTRATAMFQKSAQRHGVSTRASEVLQTLRDGVPCPVTSLYSKTDGLVPWQACRAEDGEGAENIAVPSSHVGLFFNPLVLAAIRDRLALDPPLATPFRWSPVLARPWNAATDGLAGTLSSFFPTSTQGAS